MYHRQPSVSLQARRQSADVLTKVAPRRFPERWMILDILIDEKIIIWKN